MIEAVRLYVDGGRGPGYAGPRVVPAMPSKPSEDIYRILEQVLETGVPVEIERDGRRLKIARVEPQGKLANLEPRKFLLCDPEELVSLDATGSDALEAARGGLSEADEDGFPVFAVSEGAGPITLATVQKALEEAE
ncbi:MAG TPA: hypothetical protein VFR31_03420 [Thermoanaerobaculia bacterium]|nr:hypothetical protein [Thermoanaerobaculia bacterium]